MKVDGDPLLKLLILVVTAAGQGDSPNYRGLKQTELSNYSHYHFCHQVGETCQSPMILSFAKLDIPIDMKGLFLSKAIVMMKCIFTKLADTPMEGGKTETGRVLKTNLINL